MRKQCFQILNVIREYFSAAVLAMTDQNGVVLFCLRLLEVFQNFYSMFIALAF